MDGLVSFMATFLNNLLHSDVPLQEVLLGGNTCCVLRLSGPLKEQYAKENGLDYSELLTSSSYKETHRARMIEWGERKRNREPDYFCRLATACPAASKPVWIISDARRTTDVDYFVKAYPDVTCCVRIAADHDARAGRGYVFTTGIDDAESECGLDHMTSWDVVVNNNGDVTLLDSTLEDLVVRAKTRLTYGSGDFT